MFSIFLFYDFLEESRYLGYEYLDLRVLAVLGLLNTDYSLVSVFSPKLRSTKS